MHPLDDLNAKDAVGVVHLVALVQVPLLYLLDLQEGHLEQPASHQH